MPKNVKPPAKRQKKLKKCKENSVLQSCSLPATEKINDVCSDLATNIDHDSTNNQQNTAPAHHSHDSAVLKSCSNHQVISVQTSEAEQKACDMPASIPCQQVEVEDETHTITLVKEKQERDTHYRSVSTEVVSPCKSPKFFSQSSSTQHHDKHVSLYDSHRQLLTASAYNINQEEIIQYDDITGSKCQTAPSALACSSKRKKWSQQLFSSQPQPKKFKPPIKSESSHIGNRMVTFLDHKEETSNLLINDGTGKPSKEDLTNVHDDQLINSVVLERREHEKQAVIKAKDTILHKPCISSTMKEDKNVLCEIGIKGDVGLESNLKSNGSELLVVEDVADVSVRLPGICILDPPLAEEDTNKASANTNVYYSETKDCIGGSFPREADNKRLPYHQETLVMTPPDSLQVLILPTCSTLPCERPKSTTTDEIQIKDGSLKLESISAAKTVCLIPENQSSPKCYHQVVTEKHCIELPQKCVSSETQFTDLIDRFDLPDRKVSYSAEQLNRCTKEIPLSERLALRSEMLGGMNDSLGSEMQGRTNDTPSSDIQDVPNSIFRPEILGEPNSTPKLEIQDSNSTARFEKQDTNNTQKSEVQDVPRSPPRSEKPNTNRTTSSEIQDGTCDTPRSEKPGGSNCSLRSETKGEMNGIPISEIYAGKNSTVRSERHVINVTPTSYCDPVCMISNSTSKQGASPYMSDKSYFRSGHVRTEDGKDNNIATSHKDHLKQICDQAVFSSVGSCSMDTECNDPKIDTVTLTQETQSSPLLPGETIKYNQCPNSVSEHSQYLYKANNQKQKDTEIKQTLQYSKINDLTEQKTISEIFYSSDGSQHFRNNQEFQIHAKVAETVSIDVSKTLMEPSINHSEVSDGILSASVNSVSGSNVKETYLSDKDNSKMCINLRSSNSFTDVAQNVPEGHNTLSACSTTPHPVDISATTKDVSCNQSSLDTVSSYCCNLTEPFSIHNVPRSEALFTDKHIRNIAIKPAFCSTDTGSINQNYFHFNHKSIPHMSDFPSASKGGQSLLNLTEEAETTTGSISYENRMPSKKQNVDLLADLSNSQIHQLETEDFDSSTNFFQDQTAPRSESLDNFECQLSSNILKSKNDLEARKVEGDRLVKTIQTDLISVNRQLMRLKREMETVRRILQQQHKPGMQNKHGFGFV